METASLCGKRAFGAGGALWLPRLTVIHVLNSLRRAYYDDNENARLRQHLFLGGPRGTRKTTIVKWFLRRLCGAEDILRTDKLDGSIPLYFLAGKGVRWEAVTGSVSNDGDVLPPLFPQIDYFVCPELMDWLGHQKAEFQDKMESMNVAMEEGQISRLLVKFSAISDLAAAEEELAELGVYFSRKHKSMSYDVRCAFVNVSRPLEEEEWKLLEGSGFMDRQARAEWAPSKESMVAAWLDGPGADADSARLLRAFNDKLWGLKFSHVPYPPTDVMRPLIQKYHEFYEILERELGATPHVVRSFRDWNDAAQLLTAFAVMRIASEWDVEDRGNTVPTITYEPIDLQRAGVFLQSYFAPTYDAWIAKVNVDPKEKGDRDTLVNFMLDTDCGEHFRGPDLVKWVIDKTEVSKKTAYAVLSRLQKRGWVESAAYSEYLVSAEFMQMVEFLKARETLVPDDGQHPEVEDHDRPDESGREEDEVEV